MLVPSRPSRKQWEELWARMTLFRCHFSINVTSWFGAVHLTWWWQSPSQIFLLPIADMTLLLLLKSIFPKWLTPQSIPEVPLLLRNLACYINLLFSHRSSELDMHGTFNHSRARPITQKKCSNNLPSQ